jgi:hypothetical protein
MQDMKEDINRNKEEIHIALSSQENFTEKLDSLSRQNNLKFLGIPEQGRESEGRCTQTVLDLLNYCSPPHLGGGGWCDRHIERAYRVGRGQERRGPRPVIVRFHRWADVTN